MVSSARAAFARRIASGSSVAVAVLALAPGAAAQRAAGPASPAAPAPAPPAGAAPPASPPVAAGDAPPPSPPVGALGPGVEGTRLAQDLEKPPPPTNIVYFQYGVAFATEQVLSPGAICDAPEAPCILGGGGGVVVRGGWRSKGPLYLGIAYELTKQDPNKLYRIALLQQARAEGRYYFMTARVTEPYLSAGAGVGGYGNEWAIDTWGPLGSIGGGLEYQITRRTVVGLALAYRLLYTSRFTDTAGTSRDPGIAQLIGLDLVLEQREAILTESRDRGP